VTASASEPRGAPPPPRGAPLAGAPGARVRPSAVDAVLAVVAGAYVFVATFPDTLYTGPGLDGSCRYEVSRLATEHGFGRDVAFTYGPLGFLLAPMDVARDVAGASLLRFAVQAALAACVAHALLRRRRGGALALVATQVFAAAAGLLLEYKLLLLFPWLLARRGRGATAAPLVLAAALAGAAVYVKTTLGVALLSACAVGAALLALGRGRGAWRALAASAGAFAAVAAAMGATLLRSPWDVPGWLRLSLRIADGFSVAMSLPGSASSLRLALAVLAAWTLLTAWLLRRGSAAGWVALACCGALFLAFKHAFVRHDVYHEISFAPFVLGALGFVLLEAADRLEAAGIGATAALVLFATGPLLRHMGTADPTAAWHLLDGRRGLENVRRWWDLRAERDRQALFVERAIAPDRMPGVHERVAGRTVGVIPWELTACRANELRCVANPTLQLFAAYTSALDERTALHYAGSDAPGVVLFSDAAIDRRHVALDTPATLRAVLEAYAPSPGVPAPGTWMLERRDAPAPLRLRAAGRSLAVPGSWIAAPASDGLLFAHAALDLSVGGRLAKTFFRVEPVYLDVLGCDGSRASFRLVPDVARHGLLVTNLTARGGPLPADLERRAASQACWIRFSGAGLRSFRQPVAVDWSEAPASGGPPRSGPAPAGDLEPRRAPPGGPLLSVDALDLENSDRARRLLVVRGWGVDPAAAAPAAGVLVEVAGRAAWFPTGLDRSDVAAHFGVPAYARAGFGGVVDLSGVPAGEHEVAVTVVSADRRARYEAQRQRIRVP
jgi:hypothetical protein